MSTEIDPLEAAWKRWEAGEPVLFDVQAFVDRVRDHVILPSAARLLELLDRGLAADCAKVMHL